VGLTLEHRMGRGKLGRGDRFPEDPGLLVVVGAPVHDVVDVIRVADEDECHSRHGDADDIAVLAGETSGVGERVSEQLVRDSEKR
jgi:hypothetical protein